jgi:hemerythrin
MRKTSDIIWQDVQHQALFDIIELLKNPAADLEVVRKLEAYTEYHFGLEEQYMLKLEYPGREEHIQSHNRFREEIAELLRGGIEPDDQFRGLISTFLTEWLTRHVFGIDKELEDFIQRSSYK